MIDDYLVLGEMVTAKHGRVEFVSYGNGLHARAIGGEGIPRASWSAAMQAVVSGFPKDLVYWQGELQKYKEHGYA